MNLTLTADPQFRQRIGNQGGDEAADFATRTTTYQSVVNKVLSEPGARTEHVTAVLMRLSEDAINHGGGLREQLLVFINDLMKAAKAQGVPAHLTRLVDEFSCVDLGNYYGKFNHQYLPPAVVGNGIAAMTELAQLQQKKLDELWSAV